MLKTYKKKLFLKILLNSFKKNFNEKHGEKITLWENIFQQNCDT